MEYPINVNGMIQWKWINDTWIRTEIKYPSNIPHIPMFLLKKYKTVNIQTAIVNYF